MKQYGLLIFVILMHVYNTLGCVSRCVTSCKSVPNYKYQSCKGCGLFVVCVHGNMTTKTCPHGTTWDDFFKRCQKNSSTCPKRVPNRCISNCAGLPDGDYQSCLGCHMYVTCVEGHICNNRSCPTNMVWDDFHKRCEFNSLTCPPGGSNPCMSNCAGQPNGTYQSCDGCDIFALCCHGNLIEYRECPWGTVWDDSLKRCEKTSKTCRGITAEIKRIDKSDQAENPCITNCSGKPDGSYRSCIDCGVYVMCSSNVISIMPCPGNKVWDDSLKRCQDTSTTCPKPMNRVHLMAKDMCMSSSDATTIVFNRHQIYFTFLSFLFLGVSVN